MKIALDRIDPNPMQPRRRFAGLQELADSIGRDGLLEPVMVRPKGERFEIVHGHRRCEAARLAGLTEIEATVREVSDDEAFALALVENLQRESLTPMEEADAYRKLLAGGRTQAAVAAMIGKSQSYVAHKLRLLRMPEPVTFYLQEGLLTENHTRQVAKLKSVYGEKLQGIKFTEALNAYSVDSADDAQEILVGIRPEDWPLSTGWPLKPPPPVVEGCRRFVGYVAQHNRQIPQWEQAAFWWASLAVMREASVADLAIALERWQERYGDSAAYWFTMGKDRSPAKLDREESRFWWGYWSDLRHSASLERAADPQTDKDREFVLGALERVLKAGSYLYPSHMQADAMRRSA